MYKSFGIFLFGGKKMYVCESKYHEYTKCIQLTTFAKNAGIGGMGLDCLLSLSSSAGASNYSHSCKTGLLLSTALLEPMAS